jgi:hypothetical protein
MGILFKVRLKGRSRIIFVHAMKCTGEWWYSSVCDLKENLNLLENV